MLPTRSDRIAAFLRCFAIQGSWNYRSLVASGLVYAMLPLLRRSCAGDPVRLRQVLERHLAPFNAHPYLCPMAVTALARLEQDEADPEQIARFRRALRGPLGAIGDRLVWLGWRPFCLLLSIGIFVLSGRAWASVLLFLLVYNAGHVSLRIWGFRRGWQAGLEVGRELGDAPWDRILRPLLWLNVILVGGVVVLILGTANPPTGGWWLIAAAAVGALIGCVKPGIGGRIGAILLLATPILWIVFAG